MTRYRQFDTVPLPNGASAVCLDLHDSSDPPAWIVEVFNAPNSMGDGVTDMQEGPDGLVALNPDELAAILRQPPNLLEAAPRPGRAMSERNKPLKAVLLGSNTLNSPGPQSPLSFHFDGTREELIEAFRESVAETYGPDRVEEIMAQQPWYTKPE